MLRATILALLGAATLLGGPVFLRATAFLRAATTIAAVVAIVKAPPHRAWDDAIFQTGDLESGLSLGRIGHEWLQRK